MLEKLIDTLAELVIIFGTVTARRIWAWEDE